MAPSLRSAAAVAFGVAAFAISGCGDSGSSTTPSPSPSPSPTPGPSPTPPHPAPSPTPPAPSPTPGPSPTPSPPAPETSIWAWRKDLDHGVEITYDLSGDMSHSIYGGCWRDGMVDTVGEQEVENGIRFVEMTGETGLTLFNKRNISGRPGCLMRKSRQQVDLSVIGRMELDIITTGQGTSQGKAPWYSVWLVPMNYSEIDCNQKAAEIDLLENYDQNGRFHDVSGLASNFAQCGQIDYTLPYCKSSGWGGLAATDVNHHITVKAHEDPAEGRIIQVHRCPNSDTPMDTCESGDFSEIKVTKPAPTIPDWFPIWNKELVGDNYAKYWFAVDMWFTSNTDFTLGVENVRFFYDNDTEWKMPLDYGDARPAPQETKIQGLEIVI